MITPQRAPVRPRVKRKGGDAAFLLEDEIAELVRRGCHGVVLLRGGPGWGKTTALRHLSATLPPTDAVVLLDSGDPQSAKSEMATVFLATHTLVVTAQPIAGTYAELDLELAPWGRDEWIEFLLACHPEQCKSVMARLLASEENLYATYTAEVWRVVLEEMAADETVASPLDAMICRLARKFTREQQLALSPLALDALPTAAVISWRHAVKLVPELDRRTWRLLNQPLVVTWIAAAYAARLLKEGAASDDLCLAGINQLPRSYLYHLAALTRGDQRLSSRLLRIAESNVPECHPAAVSALHLAGALPPLTRGNSAYLDGALLEGVQWPGASLAQASLNGVDFSGANLRGATLDAARAMKADFSHADLRGASLYRANLLGAHLVGADFSGARAPEARFQGADCRGACFQDAALDDAQFAQADLTDCSFCGARLQGASLCGAAIDGADFRGANLSRCRLDRLCLPAAEFAGAVFSDASLLDCTLDGLQLDAPQFDEAILTNSTFTGASMPRANFRGAILRGCGLADVEWEGADLRDADLRGAVFSMGGSRSGLVGSPYPGHGTRTGFYTDDYNDLSTHKHPEEIRKANLCVADLRGANIEGVDFYLVDLRGAIYDRQQAEQLRRCGAILREPVT